jgi:hypothetical protein
MNSKVKVISRNSFVCRLLVAILILLGSQSFRLSAQSVMVLYGSPCVGQNMVFQFQGPGSCSTYSWSVQNAILNTHYQVIGGNSSNSFQVKWIAPVNNAYAFCLYSCSFGSSNRSSSNYNVTDNITPAVSISASNTTICQGSSVSFTASSSTAGPLYYNWQVNGTTVYSSSSNLFSTSSLNNNDQVTVVMSTSFPCVSVSTATSNAIIMTVTTPPAVTISIAGNKPSVCPGEGITFNVTSESNVGSSPTYEWFVNGVPRVTDNTIQGPKYLIINNWNDANNSTVTCKVTSSLTCVSGSPKTSSPVSVTVNSLQPFTAGILMMPSRAPLTYCPGEIYFQANPSHSVTNYSWFKNGVSVGSNSSTYVPVTYVQGDVITLNATSNASCLANTSANGSTSGAPITIKPLVSVGGVTCDICSVGSRCQAAGSTQFNSSITGADVTTWSLSNAGSSTINSSTGLVTWASDFFGTATVTVNSTGCGGPATASKIISVGQFLGAVNVTIVSNKASVCPGEGIGFNVTSEQNLGSSPTYEWFVNGVPRATDNNIQGPKWLIINNWNYANNSTVTCKVTSSLTCVSGSPKTSSPVSVTVNSLQPFTAGILIMPSRAPLTYCPGEIYFQANPSHSVTNYSWFKNGVSVGSNSSTYVPVTYVQGDVITLNATSNASCLANTSANGSTSGAPITIKPLVSVGGVTCDICSVGSRCQAAGSTQFNSSITGADVTTWSLSNAGSSTINSSTGLVTWASDFFGTATVTVNSTGCGGPVQSSKNMIVNKSFPQPSLTLSGSDFVCPGGQITFNTTNVQNGGANPIYEFYVNGNRVYNSDPQIPQYVLAVSSWNYGDGVPVKCILKNQDGCPITQDSGESNTIVVWKSLNGVTIQSPIASRCQGEGSTQFSVSENRMPYTWTSNGATSVSSTGLVVWDPTFSGSAYVRLWPTSCPSAEISIVNPVVTQPAAGNTIAINQSNCDFEFVNLIPGPNNNTRTFQLYNSQGVHLTDGLSFDLGRFLTTGTYTYKLGAVSSEGCSSLAKSDVTLTIISDCDEKLNWIETTSYDNLGVINNSRSYFDASGKGLQSQSKSLSTGAIFTSQAIKDKYDRIVGNTLSAPIGKPGFGYHVRFLLDGTGNDIFDYTDFDNTNAFSETTQGNLGWYYSANNSSEPLTPKTKYPYSRITFYEDGSGDVLFSAGPGEKLKIGSGHEVLSGTFPVANELDEYLSMRNTSIFSVLPPIATMAHEGLQKVSRDENGKYVVAISDKSGKTLVTARPGTWLTVNNSVTSTDMVYFYLLKSEPVSISGTGTYTITNLVNNQIIASPGASWPAGFYRIGVTTGQVTVNYTNHYGDISYNFYNDAGRLISSISPNGYEQLKVKSPAVNYSYIDKTTYEYNHRGWLLKMTEPDAGATQYMYRKDASIRYSQNALQQTQNRFSYTHYDQLGRPIESGEYKGPTIAFGATGPLAAKLEYANQEIWTEANVKDWVKTNYDVPDPNFNTTTTLGSSYNQQFTRGAVSWTENANITTWYSYDELGRVKWMAQKPKQLSRVFVTAYTYDFSGNVITAVQKNFTLNSTSPSSQFYHHYEYDADKRLSKTFTSLDGTNKNLRAVYQYYLHGPLKRIELGERLQGVDFVYNINGWLTSINHLDPNQDPGRDGKSGAHAMFKEDAFGMILDYYESSLSNLFQASAEPSRINDPMQFHNLPELKNVKAEGQYANNNLKELMDSYKILKSEYSKAN